MATDDTSRAARQRALEEKKRRLEEIKARRRAPAATTPTSTAGSSSAAAAGLDSYIDDLLKTSAPGLALAPKGEEEGEEKVEEKAEEKEEESKVDEAPIATPAPTAPPASAPAPPEPKVETFEIAVQCEEDDFPPPSLVDEDDLPEEKEGSDSDEESEGGNAEALEKSGRARTLSHDSRGAPNEAAPPLSEEEKSKLLSSPPFSQFLSTASKRVERLLGAGDEGLYGIVGGTGWGAGGGVDFSADYADDDDEERDGEGRSRKKAKEEAYQAGGFFEARATYEFPKFTAGRHVTDIEWCPGHKEWVLASYNAVTGPKNAGDGEGAGAGMASSNPSTRHLSPSDPSSAFLQTSATSAIPNEGIVAIYNLSMPSRPEHIFCAGCPILHAQFHPTEHPKLILGGAGSGQVLVWDARAGRYPVQRSSAQGGGHDCELVGMKAVGADGGGSGAAARVVTASSDGKVNYWAASNLREPAERVRVDAHLSCLETLHGTTNEGVVCGDEKGGLHAIFAGTGREGSSSAKRVVKVLHPGGVGAGDPNAMEDDPDAVAAAELAEMGHYGMVTAVAARPAIAAYPNTPRGNKDTASTGTAKGFSLGAGGLLVTTGVDWSTKLWAPAYGDRPLVSFLSHSYDYVCDAQWSPVHPSVFATASSNGTVDVWNLASSLDQPVSGTEGVPVASGAASAGDASSQGLNRLRWSADGRRMAVAAGDKLHVLGVGEDLWKAKGDEDARIMHSLTSRGLVHE
ncbi:hypothetical protein ACHAXT_006613 [Thalassiosira profunda]